MSYLKNQIQKYTAPIQRTVAGGVGGVPVGRPMSGPAPYVPGIAGGPAPSGAPDMTGKIGDMNPQMAAYKGIEALGDRGNLTASTASASPWASMGTSQQAADQAASMAGAGGIQDSSLSQAQQAMAMRGGLGGGAADRMGRAAMEGGALNAQNIRAQGMSDSLGAQMAGADLTTGADKFNAGQSQSTQAFNTQNRLNSLQGLNASNIANYGEKIKGFSAGQSANALAAAAGGKK